MEEGTFGPLLHAKFRNARVFAHYRIQYSAGGSRRVIRILAVIVCDCRGSARRQRRPICLANHTTAQSHDRRSSRHNGNVTAAAASPVAMTTSAAFITCLLWRRGSSTAVRLQDADCRSPFKLLGGVYTLSVRFDVLPAPLRPQRNHVSGRARGAEIATFYVK